MKQRVVSVYLISIIVSVSIVLSATLFCNPINNKKNELKCAYGYIKNKKHEENIKFCHTLIKKYPDEYLFYFYLGFSYSQLEKHQQALRYYVKALKLNPEFHPAWHNAALILRKNEKIADAIIFYKKALELKSGNEAYHFGLAQAYLALGNWQKGWNHLEKGRESTVSVLKNHLQDPADIAGKTIFIPDSWGLGDTIQFIRYVKLVKEHGGHTIVQTKPQLLNLLSRCKFIDELTTEYPDASTYDATISLWSLPKLFNSIEKTIPRYIQYIYPDPQLVYKWGKKLNKNTNFKIGICWSGSGTLGEKDIPLELFELLANIPGITLYSLQKSQSGCNQLNNINFNIVDFDNKLDEQNGPFMDTAAIMKHLDLVITVDTSIAHLAGALGVPVWTYIIFGPDWRWLLEQEDTPWYPSMRLFRGKKRHDYKTVIQNMKIVLENI